MSTDAQMHFRCKEKLHVHRTTQEECLHEKRHTSTRRSAEAWRFSCEHFLTGRVCRKGRRAATNNWPLSAEFVPHRPHSGNLCASSTAAQGRLNRNRVTTVLSPHRLPRTSLTGRIAGSPHPGQRDSRCLTRGRLGTEKKWVADFPMQRRALHHA